MKDWIPYYKQPEYEGAPTTTQMAYEPLVSPDGKIFCMDFEYPSTYQLQQGRISYTEEFAEFMWQREVDFLNKVKDFPWAPELLDISDHKIFFKWYGETCNDLVYGTKDLDTRQPEWRTHIKDIIKQQVHIGYLKPTMYPHSHYYDDRGNMRAFDFYACVYKSAPLIPYKTIESMVGDNSRFDAAREGDQINVETIFKSGLQQFSKWPGGLSFVYDEIYFN
jgi:hypothetical protein